MNNPVRNDIVELLRLISSDSKQLEYKAKVPIADVRSELLSMWFDDLYHPKEGWFTSAFNTQEQKFLADFNEFYSQRSSKLPEKYEQFKLSAAWHEVQVKASEVLSKLL